MEKTVLALLFVGAFMLDPTLGHTYHLGDCPVVEPMSNFEMSKFLGLWHVIQKTSTGSRCLTYNFTASSEPGEYSVEQVSEHPVLGVASVDNKYHYTGSLKAVSRETPAKMSVKFPLNILGSASFIVFMTDYETYAGVYTCQKLPASNRLSASILSRTNTLDKQFVDKIRSRLSNYGVNPYDLSIIDHTKCPQETNINLDINPDTFSASNIASGVRKAGEKLGDGIETVASGARRVYDAAKNDDVEFL